jgi:thiol:disulfide interchange protein
VAIDQRSITVALYLCAVLFLGAALCREARGQVQQQAAEKGILDPITTKTDLYPANVNAPNEIDEALKGAAREKKRVLLVFGANWCYDCHVLDRALHEGATGKVVQESFLVVHVDIGEGDQNLDLAKKYKIPIEKGVPAVAIVGGDGHLLYSSGAGEFESARSMMKTDLLAFLNQWKKAE